MSQQRSQGRIGDGTGRALVVTRQPDAADCSDTRPLAQFLAQLIACRKGLAPFRKARKAPSGSARLAYARATPAVRPATLDVRF